MIQRYSCIMVSTIVEQWRGAIKPGTLMMSCGNGTVLVLAFKKDHWQHLRVISPPAASKFTQNSSKLVKFTVRSPFLEPACVFETLDSSKYKINSHIEKSDYCSISPSLKSLSLALKAIKRVQTRWNFQLALWTSWNHYTQVWKLFLSSIT